jgi:hypothetical protein
LRITVECGVPGEELRLGVVMIGSPVLAIRALLEPGRPVRVSGHLRVLKTGGNLARPEDAFEVVADLVEPADS